MFSLNLLSQAYEFLELARKQGISITTAESCTGGLIAALLTEIPGSSDVFERGFVTYSNAAKTELIGVPAALIEAHGAVSAEVAAAMAEGALRHAAASLSVAVTGIAGPGGGSATKPLGPVFIASARTHHKTLLRHLQLHGDRGEIRLVAVGEALRLMTRGLAVV